MALQFPDVDEDLVEKIVDKLKSQGIFDQFRKDCLADVDSRPACQNLRDKVNGAVADFLSKQPWKDDLSKNQVRESLRKHVQQHYLEVGVNKIVEQVVNPKIFSVFTPKVEDVVYQVMGIEKPINAEDRSHNRLRYLMSNNIPQPSPGNVFSGILPSDLDPVSPGSINESANLNDSVVSKTGGEIDNASRDVNKESNIDVNEVSNESKVSGISELSSHGSTTKLDISESAHLPGDKSEMNCDVSSVQNQICAGDREKSKGVNESVSGSYDFDNFSNLKEKLLKTDPLNKNTDKEKGDPTSSSVSDNINEDMDPSLTDVIDTKKKSTPISTNKEEKTEKTPKSPVSFMYSEDSMGSNGSERSKMKLEKIHSLNESTRNSIAMDCEDSSVSFADKKFEAAKENESVSCIESLKEESQMSVASNDSRKFGNFVNLKFTNENSQNRSLGSSPDTTKNILDPKKKDEGDRKNESHLSHRSSDKSDSKHRSRNSSRDRKYSKDTKSKYESDSKKLSSSSRDKYSKRDDRHRSDSKSDKKHRSEDSKRDRDSKHSSSCDDKNRKDSFKHKQGEDNRSSRNRGKDSQNSSDDDKKSKKADVKSSSTKEKDSKPISDKSSKDKDSKSNYENKYSSSKKEDKKGSDDSKSSKPKDNDSKNSSVDRKTVKEKSRIVEDDKYSKKDKDLKKSSDDYRSSRTKEDAKNSSSTDKDSKSSSHDRKSSSSKTRDSKQNSEDDRNSRKDKDKSSDITDNNKPSKNYKSADNADEDKGNKSKSDTSDKAPKTDKKSSSDRKGESSDKRKSSNETTSKKDDKDSKKRKRENCNEETEKKDNRRSRDRDDSGHRSSGGSSSRDHKESADRKRKSGSSRQEKTSPSTSKETSAKEQVDSLEFVNSNRDIDSVLKKIDSSFQYDNGLNESVPKNCGIVNKEMNEENLTFTSTELITLEKVTYNILEEQTFVQNEKPLQTTKDDFQCTTKEHNLQPENINFGNEDIINESIIETEATPDCKVLENILDKNEIEENNSETNIIGSLNNSGSSSTNISFDKIEKTETSAIVSNFGDNHSQLVEKAVKTVYDSSDEGFFGFDQLDMDYSFKCAMNFENYMKNTFSSASSLEFALSDKCFSLTDNNLNNIDIKNNLQFLVDSPSELYKTSYGSTCPIDNDKNGKILSPLSKSVVSNILNEIGENPQESFISHPEINRSENISDTTGRANRKYVEGAIEKTSDLLTSAKEAVQMRNEDVISLCESSCSERGFTLPSVTEDMLDNFMLENIVDKLDSCYNSSDSDVESWNVPVTPDAIFLTDIDDEPSSVKKDELVSDGIVFTKESSEQKVNLSEKSSSPKGDKKSFSRVSQRYNDGELYKPRPLITNPSRRNRVTSKNGSKPTRGTKRSADSMEFSENKRPR